MILTVILFVTFSFNKRIYVELLKYEQFIDIFKHNIDFKNILELMTKYYMNNTQNF